MSQGYSGQHEQAVVMAQIAKYKVDPASYLGGRDTDKEYLRRILFAPLPSSSQTNQRKELSDRLGSELASIYHPMKSYANPIYGGIGGYN